MKALEHYSIRSRSGRELRVLWYGIVEYSQSYQAMLDYASNRTGDDPDQLWLLEHPKVYTQGTACDLATLMPSEIPVIKTDRGGQITYHGPGQIVIYPLLHLRNFGLGVKALVNNLEQSVIDWLNSQGVVSDRRTDAPGVYVNEAKIAALGLRIRRGNSYHGLSFNVDMDLAPFSNIDPCGYQGLQVTQLSQHARMGGLDTHLVGRHLATQFASLI